jgi:WD40 repeat protein
MAKLFVSYSRKDSTAARKLIDSFRSIEQEVWVDWESIPPAVDWLEQIFRGIEEADAFIFLISPDSIASEVCKVEIGRAALNNKRIIPIVLRDVAPKDTPESIRKLNWTFMRETDNFEEGLAKVKTAIELDLDWLEEHRRLQVRALEWHRKKDPSLLLRGRDLHNADRMMQTATSKDPTPTGLQKTFILYSRQNQRNRTLAVIAGTIALVIMAFLAYTARQESIRATQNEQIAVTQRVIADQKRDEAEQSAEEANRQRLAADEARQKEAEARALAEQNEKEAEAQRSAARAQIYQNRPGELFTSTLLAIDSLRRYPTDEAEDILRRNLGLLPVPVTQLSQGGKINALAFNPQGNTFVTASADGTACAWRLEEKKVSRLFCTPADRPSVNAIAFSPDGSYMVMGDQSGLVQVLDAETGSVLHAYLRVRPQSNTIQLVDVKNGALQDKFTPMDIPVRSVSIRPSGGEQIAVAYDDGRIPVFDLNTGKISSPLWTGERPNLLGFSPNGNWLVVGSESGRVTIWNLVNSGGSFSPVTHRRGVLALAFSPKENKLATGGNDSTTAMISLGVQKELFRIVNQSSVRALAFSPDGSWFVTGSDDHRVRIWDSTNGDERLAMSQDGIVTDVAVSADGQWIAAIGDDRTARVWDAETGAEIFQIPLKAHGALLAFCNDDRWLVTADERGAIEIWDISRVDLPKLSVAFDGIVENVQYSPSGQRLAVSSEDQVWLLTPDSESGLKERAVGPPVLDLKSNVLDLIFSHDANLLGVLTQENEVGVYNIEQRTLHLMEVPAQIQSIAFSPDNQHLITSDTDGSLQAWSVLDGALVPGGENLPQGSILTSAGDVFAIGSQDKVILLSADGDGGLPPLEPGADQALLVFSADGSLLASGSSTGKITIFRSQGSQFTEQTSFVKDEAASLAFHPAGTLLAVGTAKNVYLMDTASGKELARIPHLATVNGLSFSADGNYLAAASSKTLQIWEMANIRQIRSADLIPAACSHLFENFSPGLWDAFFRGESYEPLCENLPVPQ